MMLTGANFHLLRLPRHSHSHTSSDKEPMPAHEMTERSNILKSAPNLRHDSMTRAPSVSHHLRSDFYRKRSSPSDTSRAEKLRSILQISICLDIYRSICQHLAGQHRLGTIVAGGQDVLDINIVNIVPNNLRTRQCHSTKTLSCWVAVCVAGTPTQNCS